MSLSQLIRVLQASESFQKAQDSANQDGHFSAIAPLHPGLIAALAARRNAQGEGGVTLVIAATSREADALHQAVASLLPDATTCELPAWETLPHERLSPSAETVGRRLQVLHALRGDSSAEHLIVFMSIRAAIQPISAHAANAEPIVLRDSSSQISLDELTQKLVHFSYNRVDMVTRRGEFAVRGGILDVFETTAEHAVRIDFFGDTIDLMRHFSVADQRSAGDPLRTITIWPAREMLLTEEVRHRAGQMRQHHPGFEQMLTSIEQGITVEGMESLQPILLPNLQPITALMPPGGAVVIASPERVLSRAHHLAETDREFFEAAWQAAGSGGDAPASAKDGGLLSLDELRAANVGRPWQTITTFVSGDEETHGSSEEIAVHATLLPSPPLGASVGDAVLQLVRDRLHANYTVIVAAEGPGMIERARDVLKDAEIAARIVDDLPDRLDPGVVYLVTATVAGGFEDHEAALTLLSEIEFFGRSVSKHQTPTKLAKRRSKQVVDPLQLQPGDYVVHETHGIGQFVELTQRMVPAAVGGGPNSKEKVLREYVVLEYASSKRGMPRDKLYVPTDQLDQLSRYVGGEAPSLSKMGGSDWASAKSKARKAVRDIAVELVKLYAARMSAPGYAFSADTPWQHELEEAFPYVETRDQLTTIDEVKRDMEKSVPMDRLISGDVGFGKTEIAVRAAFKAVQDGKQVVVLAPTTLLVGQHFETFQSRMAGFPVRLRALSRFQSDAEARDTIEGLAAGTVDIVIGTHRLLSDQVRFKDLGLVIIDEEQRFGVEHKDALKKLKTGVDILAMSATPIPRTLEMAVTGIREMSTLATPPEDRHPILTFVGPRSDKQIAAAIRREMLREGQVFFVHNRVQSIGRMAAHIADLVPEARVAVAHGRLGEHQLEQVVLDFWERKYDVLVSTTIIETGLDIANANTIIIDNADKYGLSQLHQLRGRVGRARERAYAYFLYDPDKPLTEHAHERLNTIAMNNDLGSGMQVALKDLELRGAGNLLGGEQSGHIAGVGFDLYLRMIGEAVSAFKGEDIAQQQELILELPVDARIPDHYLESERLRLEAYQKFSAASHPASPAENVDLVVEELTDRYGKPVHEVQLLAEVSKLRRRAALLGVTKVIAAGKMLRIEPVELPSSRQMRMSRLYPGASFNATSHSLQVPLPDFSASESGNILSWVSQVFTSLLEPEPVATDTTKPRS